MENRMADVSEVSSPTIVDDAEQNEREDQEDSKLNLAVYTADGNSAMPYSMQYDVEMFINELHEFPCIWDPTCRAYRDQEVKKAAWEDLSKTFNKNVEFLKIQWKNMRDNLRRCLIRREKMSQSGAEAHTLARCRYFEQLAFLHDRVMNKETSLTMANMSPGKNNGERSSPVRSNSHDSDSQTASLQDSEKVNYIGNNAISLNAISLNAGEVAAKRKASEALSVYFATRKRSEGCNTQADCMLLNTSKDLKSTQVAAQNEETEDNLFFKSLLPTMRKLSPKKNKMAKMKIQQLLFDLEFGEGS